MCCMRVSLMDLGSKESGEQLKNWSGGSDLFEKQAAQVGRLGRWIQHAVDNQNRSPSPFG
jgi:hypothetical protein